MGSTHTWKGDGPILMDKGPISYRKAVNSSVNRACFPCDAQSGGEISPSWQEAAWLSLSMEVLRCVVTIALISLRALTKVSGSGPLPGAQQASAGGRQQLQGGCL